MWYVVTQGSQRVVGGGGGGGQPVMATGPVNLTPEQLAKLRSELDIVQQNCKVFGEMLTEMSPGQDNNGDLELLQVSQSLGCQRSGKKIIFL